MNTQSLHLDKIDTNAGTQIRARVDLETVDQYAEAMADGAQFPPVTVFDDGNQFILADGFHRVMAAARNGFNDILADVRKGTKLDALKFALGANAAHGLRRTNADKRRSVELALQEWPKLSDREIAKICAVSNNFVGEVRSQLSSDDSSVSPTTRIGADGKERKLPARKIDKVAELLALIDRAWPELKTLEAKMRRGVATKSELLDAAEICRAIANWLESYADSLDRKGAPRP